MLICARDVYKHRFIAKELAKEDHYQFMYPIKPGIQEFIEALTFLHYLKTESLMDYADVKQFCGGKSDSGQGETL